MDEDSNENGPHSIGEQPLQMQTEAELQRELERESERFTRMLWPDSRGMRMVDEMDDG